MAALPHLRISSGLNCVRADMQELVVFARWANDKIDLAVIPTILVNVVNFLAAAQLPA